MARPASRFSPPPVDWTPEHRWLLGAAFGPRPAEPTPDIDRATALDLAETSGLAPRIGSRLRTSPSEVNSGAVSRLRTACRKAASHAVAYEGVLEELGREADALGVPIVVLKGMALHLGGYSAPGSREIGDLDVLTTREGAGALFRRLEHIGFRTTVERRNEHHHPPLVAPNWGVVDLHDLLRGVRGESRDWLTAEATLELGTPREIGRGCWLPDRRLLAAHALAHAIDQHGHNPHPYPLLRAIGDLLDLLPTAADWSGSEGTLAHWLDGTVVGAEVAQARDLCSILAAGDLPSAASPAHALLAHFIAHNADPQYRESLRARHHRGRALEAGRRGTLLRYAARKLADWLR